MCVVGWRRDHAHSYTNVWARGTDAVGCGREPPCMCVGQVRARAAAGFGAFCLGCGFVTARVCVWGGWGVGGGGGCLGVDINSASYGCVCVCERVTAYLLLCAPPVAPSTSQSQVPIVVVALTVALVLLALVTWFLLSGR